jgi:hypothetical protein
MAPQVTTGLRAPLYQSSLGKVIDRYERDPDPLKLFRELATLRALAEQYIVNYEEFRDQLNAWYIHEIVAKGSDKGVQRPPRILDLYDARILLDDIGKMVARIEKIRSQNAISRPELERLMAEMGRIVKYTTDEETATRIWEGWRQIRVRE